MGEPYVLWGVLELAAFFNYSPKTVTTLLSRSPEKLPPRVSLLSKPRWDPGVVRQWTLEHSRPVPVKRVGRPRKTPILVSSPSP